jgi:hypothetical protein
MTGLKTRRNRQDRNSGENQPKEAVNATHDARTSADGERFQTQALNETDFRIVFTALPCSIAHPMTGPFLEKHLAEIW